MLYTLIGNGNVNRKEALTSLKSLKEATENKNDEFWMILIDPLEEFSDTYKSIVKWILQENVSFEYVTSKKYIQSEDENLPSWAHNAEYRHFVSKPTLLSVMVTDARPPEGEDKAILVLSDDDVEHDEELLKTVEKAFDLDIPVYQLGGQMVQLVIEDNEEPPILETPKEFHIDTEELHAPTPSTHDVEFTKEDLEGLTRDELKSMVSARGLVPKDMRSKEALMESLLESISLSPKAVEAEQPQERRNAEVFSYFLLRISSSGESEVISMPAEAADLISKKFEHLSV
jgi:phosphoenolpyruvate synthase/pyruvate phosphate dikinase